MKEIWKDVVNYEGRYQVSNYGRVRALEIKVPACIKNSTERTIYTHIKKPSIKKDYLQIGLSKDGVQKWFSVHRLVATAFVPNPDGKKVVNHINNNPRDNRAENLEWVTPKENTEWASKQGRLHSHDWIKTKCREKGIVFDSSYKAAEWINENKFHNSHRIDSIAKNIRGCVHGTRPKAYGYHWDNVFTEGSTTIL